MAFKLQRLSLNANNGIDGIDFIDVPTSGGSPTWGSITGTMSAQTDLQSALDAKQPLDSDLTTLASLTATTDNFIISVASAWASRTPAQAKTTLALVKGDVGLGNVDNTSDANKPVSSATQTALDAKQATLVSGTNIKTINGSTVLGSGDLVVGTTPVKTCGVTFDGGGSTPTVGTVGYIVVPFSGTVSRWDFVADQSGSAVVDVWKAAGAIPTDANRIAGTEKPTLSAAQLASDTSLTTWSTLAVTAGDVFGFELESVTTCTRLTVEVSINQS